MNSNESILNVTLPNLWTVRNSSFSRTKIKLAQAFINNFGFEPWLDFEDKALELLQDMNRVITVDQQTVVKSYYSTIKGMVEPPNMSQEALENIPRKYYHGLVESALAGGARVCRPYPCTIFHNELSTIPLYSNFFAIVNEIVQRMTGTVCFQIRPTHLKSQLLLVADSEAKKSRMIQGAPRTNGERTRNALPAGGEEVERRSGRSEGDGQHVQRPLSTQTGRSVPPLHHNREISDPTALPDYTLLQLKHEIHQTGERVCCFVAKGPHVNITGRGNENVRGRPTDPVSVSGLVRVPDEGITDSSFQLAKRLQILFEEKDTQPESSGAHSEHSEIRNQPAASSARRARGEGTFVADQRDASATVPEEVEYHESGQHAIAQALGCALGMTGGCTYLMNWGDGVALEVSKKRGKRKGRVRVALVREVGQSRVGHVLAASYTSVHSVARSESDPALEDGLKDLRKLVRESLLTGSRGTKRARSASAADAEQPPASGRRVVLGGSKMQSTSARTSPEGLENEESSTHSASLRNEGEALKSGNPRHTSLIVLETLRAKKTTAVALLPDSVPAVRNGSREEVVELLAQASRKKYGVEMPTTFYKSKWLGRDVAVKVWRNENHETFNDEFDHISKEIHMYIWLRQYYPSVVGSAVPMLRMYWHFRDYFSARLGLVLDFVGNEIAKVGEVNFVLMESNGTLHLTNSDVNDIKSAAVESLTKLHTAGIRHGGIELKNLRVQRYRCDSSAYEAGHDKYSWKAWWIDLRLSSRVAEDNRSLLHMELRRCKALLRTPSTK